MTASSQCQATDGVCDRFLSVAVPTMSAVPQPLTMIGLSAVRWHDDRLRRSGLRARAHRCVALVGLPRAR